MVERRLIWLAGIVLVWGGAILVKLVSLQVVHHQDYVRKARARQEETVPLRAQRGAILDRTGHPLALSVPTEAVTVDPRNMPSLEFDSDLLARELHLPAAGLFERIKAAKDEHRGFFLIKRGTARRAQDTDKKKADKTSLASSVKNIPGALFKALSVFALRDISLSKIESRPMRGRPWEYVFFVDLLRGDDEASRNALRHLGEITDLVKVLGIYEEA